MKSIALIFLLVFLTSGLKAAGKSTDNFVVIGDETYYYDEIRVGKSITSIYIDGKRFLKVRNSIVNAYAEKGNFYEYLPIMTQDKDTAGYAFMQFIASRDGYRLYRYCSNCLKYDPVTCIIAPATPVYRYYIFKSSKFVLVTDDQNEKSQLAYFGVKVVN